MKKLSRLEFIKLSGLAYVAFQFGCTPSTKVKRTTLSYGLEFLLSEDGEFPTYKDINTEKYIAFLKENSVLEDFQLERLTNGESTLNKLSLERFNRELLDITLDEKETIFKDFIETDQGYTYFSFLQKLQIETMFADAYYDCSNSTKIKSWLKLPVMFPSADKEVNFATFSRI